MACEFGLYYPEHLTATGAALWEPSSTPIISSDVTDDDGVLVDDMADGQTQYVYEIGDRVVLYRCVFRTLTDDERDGFRAFKQLALGREFEMLDPLTDSYITVTFDAASYDLEWEVLSRDPPVWGVTVALRAIG